MAYSPGALVKNGKKCYKADFFQNSYVISCIITYQKPKKILLFVLARLPIAARGYLPTELTSPPLAPRDSNSMYFSGGVHTYADNIDDTLGKNSFDS